MNQVTQTPRVVRTNKKPNNKKKTKQKSPPWVQTTKRILGVVGKIFLSTALVLTITCCIVGTALTIYVMQIVDSESIIDLNTLKLNYTAIIYAKDEKGVDVELERLAQKENRIWVNYSEIPQDLKDAVVFTEDERFDTHDGVDFKRTIAAFANLLLHPKSTFGGSTITQQLVKNINGDFFERNKAYDLKIKEIVTAMNIEKNFSKDEILECYLNYISLDNNINGVQAGAKYYFNKDVKNLTLNECATLGVISKSPSTYNPVKHPENNNKRRMYALDKLLQFNCITQAEYDANIKSMPKLSPQKTTTDTPAKKEYTSYFTDSVLNEVIKDLCAKYKYSPEHAEQLLFTQGWKVYTTMEVKTQKILEDYFKNPANFNRGKEINKTQAYMTIMDLKGNTVAMVGGKGPKTGDRVLNRVTSSKRPAGSTIKPLSIYTPAFENDIITWSQMMDDAPVMEIDDGKGGKRPYPQNFNRKFEGSFSIIDAIKVSKNTIPVRLCNMLKPQTCFDFAYKKLGLKTLIQTGSHNNVNPGSMALGDGGTTLYDLTAAFQIFGNGGYYTEPKMYSKVINADGETVLDTTIRANERVMSSQTAYIMNKALGEVVTGGSGSEAKMKNFEVVGKTGTSNERRDLLFMGVTPYYVAGIRYGYDNNDVIEEKDDGLSQMVVWKNVMTKVLASKKPAQFKLDEAGIIKAQYCTSSGLLAHSACTAQKSGYYKESHQPAVCSIH